MSKRILLLAQYFSFPDFGDSTRWYDLSTALTQQGFQVTVITSDAFMHLPVAPQFEQEGIRFMVLNAPLSNHSGYFWRVIQFLRFSFFACRKTLFTPCDVVIATSTPLTIVIPALLNRMMRGIPFIFEVRDVWPEAPIAIGALTNPLLIRLSKWLEKTAYRKAAHIVALSPDMMAKISEHGPKIAQKTTTIPNIANLALFSNVIRPAAIPEQYESLIKTQKILLYTGTFGQVNGLSYTVDLFSQVKNITPDIVFVAFGKGKERENIIQKAKTAGIWQENYFIFDPIPKKDLPWLLHTCTASSSWVIDVKALWANSANKYFDAMAAAKPIIINYGGWQKAEIAQRNTGWVMPPEIDKKGTAAQELVNYLQNAAQLQAHGQNALALAREKYSLEVSAKKLIGLLKGLLNRGTV